MKLAEVLQERADLNRKIRELEIRIRNNSLVQEGDTTSEDAKELLNELNRAIERLTIITGKINMVNSTTKVKDRTLTEIIARKDTLTTKLSIYRNIINYCSVRAERSTRNEIKIFTTMNVKELQKEYDVISKEIRELDNLLQESNWTIEVNI